MVLKPVAACVRDRDMFSSQASERGSLRHKIHLVRGKAHVKRHDIPTSDVLMKMRMHEARGWQRLGWDWQHLGSG